jgi:glucose-6-phosphate 1-epimerase
VSLMGAQLLSYGELLWLSPSARFSQGMPIRGGVPLCWPWFGPHPTQAALPQHGFARVMTWTWVQAGRGGDGSVEVALELRDSPQSREWWDEAFGLRLELRFGEALELTLRVTNTGTKAWSHQAAFHPYLGVADLRRCRLLGLEGKAYLEKRGGKGMGRQDGQPLRMDEGLDRIYFDTAASCRLLDGSGGALDIAKTGAADSVVWNPGPGMQAPPADLPAPSWKDFVCVEALSSHLPGLLEAGASQAMSMRLGKGAHSA